MSLEHDPEACISSTAVPSLFSDYNECKDGGINSSEPNDLNVPENSPAGSQ